MFIRPARPEDVARINEIDGAVESVRYLHVERTGEGIAVGWTLDERPLRARTVERNALGDERLFLLKQTLAGIEEGLALVAEHEDELIALALAGPEAARGVLEVRDVRVESEYRRQGLGSAMMFQIIAHARGLGVRAVSARTLSSNVPACQFMVKLGFELAGIDTHYCSNHDLVKEAVSLFWYLPLD